MAGDDLIRRAAELCGASADVDAGSDRTDDATRELGVELPRSVAALLDYPTLLPRIAGAFDARLEFPSTCGVEDGLLRIMDENQSVCWWGVPLDEGDDPPVYVVGDNSRTRFSATVAEFAFAFAWDLLCVRSTSLVVQAQAAPLAEHDRAHLANRCREGVSTHGWPTPDVYRFESPAGARILLWSDDGQCDWLISAHQPAVLQAVTRDLLGVSDLATSLWSTDPTATSIIDSVRAGA